MVAVIAKESPEIEYMRTDQDDYSEEKKHAIEVLANLALVIPDNERYANYENQEVFNGAPANSRTVAIKKSKVNAFNDRDGVLFYALREA